MVAGTDMLLAAYLEGVNGGIGRFPIVFLLEIHHGGVLSEAPDRFYYEGKKVNWFEPYVSRLRFKLMQLYVVHLVDKPKPIGDNENPDIGENFDSFFCDLDPDVPNVAEPSEVPDVAEQSEGSEDSEETKDNDFYVELEDKIDDVEVDMDDFRKFTDENVEWVGHDEVPIEDTQPVEAKYARLKDYVLELQEHNLDTTIKIDVERTCEVTTVGVDPNNGAYPLAYVVIEAETKESWTWFLDCLGDDLQLVKNSNFTLATARPSANQSQSSTSVRDYVNQSQTSVNPSAPTVNQSQTSVTFVRPAPSLQLHLLSGKLHHFSGQLHLLLLQDSQRIHQRLSPIKNPAGVNGKGKNVQELSATSLNAFVFLNCMEPSFKLCIV
ncbi:hypothetical protein Tco_0168439 [Tanacetum coccineum]